MKNLIQFLITLILLTFSFISKGQGGIDCNNFVEIGETTLNNQYTGLYAGGINLCNSYFSNVYYKLYKYQATDPFCVHLNPNSQQNLDLYILNPCDPTECITQSNMPYAPMDDEVTVCNPGTYYILVIGPGAPYANFSITISKRYDNPPYPVAPGYTSLCGLAVETLVCKQYTESLPESGSVPIHMKDYYSSDPSTNQNTIFGPYISREKVYAIDPTYGGITMNFGSFGNTTVAQVIMKKDQSDGSIECVKVFINNQTITWNYFDAGYDYFLVIDGIGSISYTMNVSYNPCPNNCTFECPDNTNFTYYVTCPGECMSFSGEPWQTPPPLSQDCNGYGVAVSGVPPDGIFCPGVYQICYYLYQLDLYMWYPEDPPPPSSDTCCFTVTVEDITPYIECPESKEFFKCTTDPCLYLDPNDFVPTITPSGCISYNMTGWPPNNCFSYPVTDIVYYFYKSNGEFITSCTTQITITSIQNNVTITATADTCSQGSATATAHPSGGTAPYTYLWSNGSTNQTATGLIGGTTYSVTTTDANGCKAQSSIQIQNIKLLKLKIDLNGAYCGSENVTATAVATGGTLPYQYDWSTGDTTKTIDSLPNGIYHVTVTSSNGCTGIDSVAVNIYPAADAGDDLHVFCFSKDSLTLNATDTGYWQLIKTVPDSLTLVIVDSTKANSLVNSFSGAGTYTLLWTTIYGCTDTLQIVADSICDCSNPPNITLSMTTLTACDTGLVVITGNTFINADSLFILCDGLGAPSLLIDTTSFSFSYNIAEEEIGDTITFTLYTNDPDSTLSCRADTVLFRLVAGERVNAGKDTMILCWVIDSVQLTSTTEGVWSLVGSIPDSLTATIEYADSTVSTIKGFSAPGSYILARTNPYGCSDTMTVVAMDDCPCFYPPEIILSKKNSVICSVQTIIITGNRYKNADSLFISTDGRSNTYAVFDVTDSTFSFLYDAVPADLGKIIEVIIETEDPDGTHKCIAAADTFRLSVNQVSAGDNITVDCWKYDSAYVNATVSGPGSWSLVSTSPPGLTCNILEKNAPTTYIRKFSGIGTYRLRWTDASGCFDDLVIQTNESCPCEIAINVSSTDALCGTDNGTVRIEVTEGEAPFSFKVIGPKFYTVSDVLNTIYTFTGLSAGTYQASAIDAKGCVSDTTITIQAIPSPVIDSISVTPIYCFGGAGMIRVHATEGTPPFLYSLNGNAYQTDPAFTDMGAGVYNISVKDHNDCITTSEAEVIELPKLSFDVASVTHTSCGMENGSIELNVSGGTVPYKVKVNDLLINNPVKLNYISAGNYLFEVVDAHGCSSERTITINSSEKVEFDLKVSGFNCENPRGTIEVVVVSGHPEFIYRLNDGDSSTTNIFEDLPSGFYNILVVDDVGCHAEDTIAVGFERKFEALDDTIKWDFHYNPLTIDLFKNQLYDDTKLFVRPLDEIITDHSGINLGTLFNKVDNDLLLEFYFDGARKKLYPEVLAIEYLLCDRECRALCDTGIIYLVQDIECEDSDGGYVNTITPNHDGKNDVLIIPQFPKCDIILNEIKIFNRWGEAVFSRINYENNWDGTNQSGAELPAGTYYYVLLLKTSSGRLITIKSFVELIR